MVRLLGWATLGLVLLLTAAWEIGAICFDAPLGAANKLAAIMFGIMLIVVLVAVRPLKVMLVVWAGIFGIVVLTWLSQKPREDRRWQPDVAQTAWADIQGDTVTLHNVRNCDYRTETDYTPRWETRTVQLSKLTGFDLAICYWGSPWMAHPILSFQFEGVPPVCFSIETRKEVGESYSALGGLYRQFELIYVVADERDVLRLRTNIRTGEDVYLYRTTASADEARGRFMEYLTTLNSLHQQPRWYHAIATNCTSAIRSQRASGARLDWDWRFLVNGKADELLFERGILSHPGLPFEELKKRSLINRDAKSASRAENFSERIRRYRPGFVRG
jgi:hypothetical protein